ncbi:hypothetical protein BDA99DRAFT_544260 [Phascolomyces articulosus]|uniref:Uncharacterized protein n=1 Tax=Phascolomyces articulosus TaxID=60185 RepID=A0AAD5P6Y6_9FUNG|nr:hypothetical protein BDA99DRAFT_544260 [Phascolomyces articulosus]
MVDNWFCSPPLQGESINASVSRLKNAPVEALEFYSSLIETVRVEDDGIRFVVLEGERSRPCTPFIFEMKDKLYSIKEDPRDMFPRISPDLLDSSVSVFLQITIAIGSLVYYQIGDGKSLYED